MEQYFIGFYTSRRFWAIDEISFENNKNSKDLYHLMEQIVFSHEEDTFSLLVCRDGMILFKLKSIYDNRPSLDAPDWSVVDEWWNTYFEYVNCISLLFHSSVIEVLNVAYIDITELTRKDILLCKLEKGNFISYAMEDKRATYQLHDRQFFLYGIQPSIHSRFFMRREVLSKDIFKNLANKVSIVLPQQQLVSRLATLNKSLLEYKSGNYAISLILAWFVIEDIISNRWYNFLQSRNYTFSDGRKRIDSDRLENLTEGRDYPISVILNVLELNSLLPYDIFTNLNLVRSYRNKIVHRDLNFKCTDTHPKEAIKLALALSLEGQKIDMKIDYGFLFMEPR